VCAFQASGVNHQPKRRAKTMKIIQKTIMVSALGWALATTTFAQTNLQFTAATSTDEQAIRLSWASQSNHVYQIQCANALATNADGSTAWFTLYDDYPSQGTNTFWLDSGNYYKNPPILHPKNMPMRFYRILDEGSDTTSDEPTISIVSPTNGFVASGSLTVSVAASTDQATLATKLYVDGQEMQMSDDGSNYVINTCEWGNGIHTLFATAKCTSDFEGPMGVGLQSVAVGHAVSSYVPVTFNNLISRISFSEPLFNPDAGQTQQVSAVFAANSDWNLNIVDAFSNVVFTTTGSGTTMQYYWDGNGNGETSLPAGIYYYYISAQANGESSDIVIGGSSVSDGGTVPSPSFARSSGASSDSSSPTELWAVPADLSDGPVPLALYPPGVDTNDLTIFQASPAEIQSLRPLVVHVKPNVAMNSGSTFSAEDTGGAPSAPASQSAPPAPNRPPSTPAVKIAGTFGIAYQRCLSTNISIVTPLNGFPVLPGQQAQHVKLNTNTMANVTLTMPAEPMFEDMANTFVAQMENGGWSPSFVKVDDDLRASDLQGSGNVFNQVNLGFLMLHGSYGTTIDYNANQTLDIYFAVENRANNNASWVRLSDMSLGSANSATNSLRWMVIFACNSLRQANYNSMNNGGTLPINNKLHLLFGGNSLIYPNENIAGLWARAILGLSFIYPQQLRSAWYDSARTSYGIGTYPNTIKLATAGWTDNFNDTLQSTNGTSGDLQYESVQVYP
jgi:hypothetical protein